MLDDQSRSRYAIDTSAVCDLEGVSPATSYTNDSLVREKVWTGIKRLIEGHRLVTVYAAKDEFQRRCPTALDRLGQLSTRFFLQDSVALFSELPNVLTKSPYWTRQLNKAKPNRDPADPYLIALASLEGHIIVTNEKHRRDRTNTRGDRIPDVAERFQGITCLCLDEFIQRESLLLVAV